MERGETLFRVRDGGAITKETLGAGAVNTQTAKERRKVQKIIASSVVEKNWSAKKQKVHAILSRSAPF